MFLAIVQPFYSSKPYHKSLHSCSLSISISHVQTQKQDSHIRLRYVLFWLFSRRHGIPLLSRKLRWESYAKPYFSQILLSLLWGSKHFTSCSRCCLSQTRIITFVYQLRRLLSWCKHRARLARSKNKPRPFEEKAHVAIGQSYIYKYIYIYIYIYIFVCGGGTVWSKFLPVWFDTFLRLLHNHKVLWCNGPKSCLDAKVC